ncbi:MAG: NAD(P)H-dependent oxidoreductase [Phycisphaerae bacterium]|nr:NAD(P)H-dependent oxidoreductase [Phycisphaerae bacterium]
MTAPKILAFAGSARRDSFNVALLAIAVEGVREAGGEVTLVSMRDYPMPMYDGDMEAEQGLPEHALRFKALLNAHAGILIACPEYNSSITPLLKNTIDWTSRPSPGQPSLQCYQGKVAGLLSAAPGALGGLRGLVTVRSILGNIGVTVIPQQFSLSKAGEAFDDQKRLKDESQAAKARAIAATLTRVTAKLAG